MLNIEIYLLGQVYMIQLQGRSVNNRLQVTHIQSDPNKCSVPWRLSKHGLKVKMLNIEIYLLDQVYMIQLQGRSVNNRPQVTHIQSDPDKCSALWRLSKHSPEVRMFNIEIYLLDHVYMIQLQGRSVNNRPQVTHI